MKNYTYYDAYHRPRKVPGYFFQKCFGGKRGVFLVSFFIAIILGKIFLWDEIGKYGSYNVKSIGKVNAGTMDTWGLFGYLVLQRGELLGVLILAGFTRLKKAVYYLCSGAVGCFMGILMLSFFRSFGWKGILLLVVSLIPQWVIYVMLFEFLWWIFVGSEKERKLSRGWAVLCGIGVACLFLCGIYLECFVNPLLIGYTKSFLSI